MTGVKATRVEYVTKRAFLTCSACWRAHLFVFDGRLLTPRRTGHAPSRTPDTVKAMLYCNRPGPGAGGMVSQKLSHLGCLNDLYVLTDGRQNGNRVAVSDLLQSFHDHVGHLEAGINHHRQMPTVCTLTDPSRTACLARRQR